MSKEKNKESHSTTPTKSVEPMFENNLKSAIETAASVSFKSPRYVVTRDGYRVSDKDYFSVSDKQAINEMKFWDFISKKHSYGEKVEIVQYDPKLHRIW